VIADLVYVELHNKKRKWSVKATAIVRAGRAECLGGEMDECRGDIVGRLFGDNDYIQKNIFTVAMGIDSLLSEDSA